MFGRRPVIFNFKQSYARFPALLYTSSRSNFISVFFFKSTPNDPLRTGHENAVSNFQRPTLRIAAGRPLTVLPSGPGWSISYQQMKERRNISKNWCERGDVDPKGFHPS